jgi:hypothetical protein
MNEDNQIDRLIKVSLSVLKNVTEPDDLLAMFPDAWDADRRNLFLDRLLEYCIQDSKEFWEQAAVIRDVKKTINQ